MSKLPDPEKTGPAVKPVDRHELDLIVEGRHGGPHGILGAHPHDGGVTIRVLKPLASSVVVVVGDDRYPLEHENAGIWAGALPEFGGDVPDYRVAVAYEVEPHVIDDP